VLIASSIRGGVSSDVAIGQTPGAEAAGVH
jgi:hypothetical protein